MTAVLKPAYRVVESPWGPWAVDPNSTAGPTWISWCVTDISATGSTSTQYEVVSPWGTWVTNGVTVTNTATPFVQQIWTGWQNTTHAYDREYQQVPAPYVPETEQQRAARLDQEAKWRAERDAREEKYRREVAEREKTRKIADMRASRLLRSCLSAAQLAELEKSNHFHVKTPDGRLWRIDHGTHNNVKLMDKEGKKPIASYCIQPADVPAGDAMLAQKLMLETNVKEFERIANVHRLV